VRHEKFVVHDLACECALHVMPRELVEGVPHELADGTALHLLARPTEPELVGAVHETEAPVGIHVADARRHRVGDEAQQLLALAHFALGAPKAARVEHEAGPFERCPARHGAADEDGHARAVLPDVFLFERRTDSGLEEPAQDELVLRRVFPRRDLRPADEPGQHLLARIAEQRQECVVGLEDTLRVGDEDAEHS
jgi:hypothetical protein